MPISDAPPVVLSDAGVVYPNGVTALTGIDLTISAGEIFGVIGESGAGKSTLLGLLTGEVAATSGSVQVLGERVAARDGAALRGLRREIGVVFQGVHLLGNRTVRQNVALPLALRGRRGGRAARAEASDRVTEMLRFVGLEARADAYPAQLSGGQRQRVGIARALVTRPRLLVCDEPTSSLDATTTTGVLDLLRDARDRLGTTVVVVTHDLGVVRDVCDRVALIEDGHLREVLTVARSRGTGHGSYLERARRELGA